MWTQMRNHFQRWGHAAVLEPVSQVLWIIGGFGGYSDVLELTRNLLPLKTLAHNCVLHFFEENDDGLQHDQFPLMLKNELETYRKKIGEVYWCSQEKGCSGIIEFN